jgi:hypothetical protein
MEKTGAFFVAAALGLALGGCFGVPLSRSKVEETLQTTSIEVGVADRAEVRRAVGQPLLSSEYWRFDVFRISDWNRGVMLFGYVPIPMWEKNEGFVVVTYRDDGRVLGVASGHRAQGFWAISSASPETSIELGDLQLWTADDHTYAAASWSRRDAYLKGVPPGDRCRLVIGCEQSDCPAVVVIEAEPANRGSAASTGAGTRIRLANSELLGLRAVVVANVLPGSYRAVALLDDRKESFAATTRFDCAAGDTRHVLMSVDYDFEPVAVVFAKRRYRATIEVSAAMPQVLSMQPLLVWGDGSWRVEAEPGR